MVEGGLLVHESSGRHRYYRLANPEVGQALEALSAIAIPKPVRSLRESDQSKALHFARTCYDHIAGEVGVALTNKMLAIGLLKKEARDFIVLPDGERWFGDFGIDLDDIRRGRRHFARQCLDWSERRHHMAGTLGAAITNRLFDLEWIERIPGGRALQVTNRGFLGLKQQFDMTFEKRANNDSIGFGENT